MFIHNKTKLASIITTSAMALFITNAAHALNFDVNETKVSVYGYAKLDIIHDIDSEIGNNINHANIRVDGDPLNSEGHTTLTAEQSRLGFTTETMVSGSMLKTNIEGDFWGGDFRLRHAYGQWNNILAGQTTTNFAGLIAGPPKVVFSGFGGSGKTNRHAQLRYTTGLFSAALESPTTGWAGNTNADGDEKSQLPDITVRYTDRSGPFRYSTSAVARYLEYDDVINDQDDNAVGWGVNFEAAMDVTDSLILRGGISHGDGVGGYIDTPPTTSPASRQANGNLETIKLTGGTVSLTADAGPGAFTVAYFRTEADLDDMSNADRAEDARESLLVNYIWSPAQRITYGIEAGWHARELVDGSDGDALRLQGMVQYKF